MALLLKEANPAPCDLHDFRIMSFNAIAYEHKVAVPHLAFCIRSKGELSVMEGCDTNKPLRSSVLNSESDNQGAGRISSPSCKRQAPRFATTFLRGWQRVRAR